MARRTIKTIDGQVFSNRCSRFENRKGYVTYRKSPFHKVQISKRGITSDDTSGLPDSLINAVVIMTVTILIIFALVIAQNWVPS